VVNKNKALGTAWESDVAKFLRSYGLDVWRMAQTGAEDQGDLGGLNEFAFEARNRAKISLTQNIDDANDRARCKESRYGVTVMKRRGKSVGDGMVSMDLRTFATLLMDFYGLNDDGFCES
jgi:hypothetical protein